MPRHACSRMRAHRLESRLVRQSTAGAFAGGRAFPNGPRGAPQGGDVGSEGVDGTIEDDGADQPHILCFSTKIMVARSWATLDYEAAAPSAACERPHEDHARGPRRCVAEKFLPGQCPGVRARVVPAERLEVLADSCRRCPLSLRKGARRGHQASSPCWSRPHRERPPSHGAVQRRLACGMGPSRFCAARICSCCFVARLRRATLPQEPGRGRGGWECWRCGRQLAHGRGGSVARRRRCGWLPDALARSARQVLARLAECGFWAGRFFGPDSWQPICPRWDC